MDGYHHQIIRNMVVIRPSSGIHVITTFNGGAHYAWVCETTSTVLRPLIQSPGTSDVLSAMEALLQVTSGLMEKKLKNNLLPMQYRLPVINPHGAYVSGTLVEEEVEGNVGAGGFGHASQPGDEMAAVRG